MNVWERGGFMSDLVHSRQVDGSLGGDPACFELQITGEAGMGSSIAAREGLRMVARFVKEQLEEQFRLYSNKAETRARLQAVLDGDGLAMVFQPILDVSEGHTAGFEALARFPVAPAMPPDRWFAEAETVGLRKELELHAVRTALAHLPLLPADAYVSVNVSPDVAATPELAQTILAEEPERIVLEITEHAPIADYEYLMRQLARLRRLGARLAIDDVGAGFASMRHVLTLQPDLIKLDRTLTRDLHADPLRQALTESFNAFGAKIGASLVAEGVETEQELRTLAVMGVDYAQGYLLGRPARPPSQSTGGGGGGVVILEEPLPV